jgi:hypothetical protein
MILAAVRASQDNHMLVQQTLHDRHKLIDHLQEY